MKMIVACLLCFVFAQILYAQKSQYLDEIKKSAEKGWKEYPGVIAQWKKTTKPNILWGYDSPAHPIYLASTLAFLYEQTQDKSYATKTAELLAMYGDLRNTYPKDYAKTRAEYMNGVPAIANFFFMAPYIRAYLRIRHSGVVDEKTRQKIETDLAGSADFIFHFPEWGAHNRAMLRAEALIYAALAMPEYPHAKKWKQMAEIIAGDNLKQWEIEDATVYHPVWLLSLFSYAEAANKPEVYETPIIKYYLEYFIKLMAPHGMIPEFGDARWSSSLEGQRFVPIFEKGAAVYKDPEMKWAAQVMLQNSQKRSDIVGVGEAYALADAYSWADESIKPQRPASLSQEVLEDVVGKKVVFRNGWDESSTYLLLNYRDEGDGGWLHREFLRQTISVEEEKMHHGHSDENSIALLMSKGSVLLSDAGYRDDLPSGKFGAFRADYFHNRIVARKNKRDKYQTSLIEFVQNSGAYRPVRTQKVDFLNLKEVDMSRTRLIDDNLGYQWDRVITYVKDQNFFIVIDGIKVLRPDYFTFSNFWHAQHVLARGEHFFDVATDSIQTFKFSSQQSLLIYFPETYAKTEGVEPIRRSYQDEQAIYQTQSSGYKAGDTEVFVTVLIPHDRSVKPKTFLPKIKLAEVLVPYKAVGLEITNGERKSILGVKIDLEMEIARENIRPRYLYDLGKVKYGDFETDAHFLFATVDKNTVGYSASNVLKVIHRGKPLMEALPNTHGLQLDGAPDRVGFVKWRYWEDTVTLR
ncbi:hypothetical protein L0337_45975 [candidate division KSB1 bacterium]|nr:hypothetical protein [candidate division KSB1 bacterium]